MLTATRTPGYRYLMPDSLTADTFDPDGDIDLIAVERAANGETGLPLTRAESARVAQLLDGAGLTAREIGRRIGCNQSTVEAWKRQGWRPGPIGGYGYVTKGRTHRRAADAA
jgi:DNA-binding CsgD family transcriptional regulator